jgi:hypothetical protein
MPALLGQTKNGREHLVEQANALSLRQGAWKYIEPGRAPKLQVNTNTETGADPAPQLYNLAVDLGETKNVAAEQPNRVKQMAALLQQIRQNGRSKK